MLCAACQQALGTDWPEAGIAVAEDDSLHIISDSDVHIRAASDGQGGRVYLNGMDVVEKIQGQEEENARLWSKINRLMLMVDCEPDEVLALESANPTLSLAFQEDGDLDMGHSGISFFSFGGACSFQFNILLNDNQLTSVDFVALKSIGGYADLSNNNLTSVDFGRITFVENINLSNNKLTSVDFGRIAYFSGSINLSNNSLTSIDFRQIRSGQDIDLSNNQLISIDFGAITSVQNNINISNNRLTSVDCTGISISGCVCADASVALTACSRCSFPACNN